MATINYLIVGGGGGGGGGAVGSGIGGGGGGGGFQASTATVSAGNSYTVTVGSGGAGGTNGGTVGTDGGNSAVNFDSGTITSTGGGGGATNTFTGLAGGSGGGGSTLTSVNGGSTAGGSGTIGQGHNGGAGSVTSTAGGGGGGASAVGQDSSGAQAGNGGNGSANSISGTSVTYAGGGGGGGNQAPGNQGTGGTGGGADGGFRGGGNSASGNTGGGGGGASASGAAGFIGGTGGSGIVIISATIGVIASATGGTHTTSGGNDIWTFTSSDTWAPVITAIVSVSDSTSVSESRSIVQVFDIGVHDSTATSENVNLSIVSHLSVFDTLTAAENIWYVEIVRASGQIYFDNSALNPDFYTVGGGDEPYLIAVTTQSQVSTTPTLNFGTYPMTLFASWSTPTAGVQPPSIFVFVLPLPPQEQSLEFNGTVGIGTGGPDPYTGATFAASYFNTQGLFPTYQHSVGQSSVIDLSTRPDYNQSWLVSIAGYLNSAASITSGGGVSLTQRQITSSYGGATIEFADTNAGAGGNVVTAEYDITGPITFDYDAFLFILSAYFPPSVTDSTTVSEFIDVIYPFIPVSATDSTTISENISGMHVYYPLQAHEAVSTSEVSSIFIPIITMVPFEDVAMMDIPLFHTGGASLPYKYPKGRSRIVQTLAGGNSRLSV